MRLLHEVLMHPSGPKIQEDILHYLYVATDLDIIDFGISISSAKRHDSLVYSGSLTVD